MGQTGRRGSATRAFAKAHPVTVTIAATLAIAAATLGVGYVLGRTTILRPFDGYFYELLLQHHTRAVDVAVIPFNLNFLRFGVTPSYLNIWVVLLLGYLAIFKRDDLGPAVLALLIAFLISGVILYFNTRFVFRPRPFTIFPNHLSAQYKAMFVHWTSWPSGHTRDTAIFAVVTAHYIPKLKWSVIVFACLVALSRVYVGLHNPTDAIGGLLIGWAIGAVGVFAADATASWARRRRAARDDGADETASKDRVS